MAIKASNNPLPDDPYYGLNKLDRGGYEGTAQDLKNEIDELALPDKFLTVGEVQKVANTIVIDANQFSWQLDKIIYSNNEFETTIAPATEGSFRIDLIVANAFSNFVKIQGEESLESGSAQEPLTPEGTLRLTPIFVSGSDFENPIPPVELEGLVEKQQYVNVVLAYGATPVIEQINLTDVRNAISLTGLITDIKSIQVSGLYIYDGKSHFVKNRTNHAVKIWHNAGTGNIKYSFPNALDYIIQPNEVVEFSTNAQDSSSVKFELVGSNNIFLNIPVGSTEIVDADVVAYGKSADGFKTFKRTFAQLKANLKAYFDTLYLDLISPQTVSGVKIFLAGRIGIRNSANTFTSFFATAVTSSRTWTWPNKDGTVAMTSDITSIINPAPLSRLLKYVGSTVAGESTIVEVAGKVGIGTSVTPTKDISIGNQADSEIGVEESENTTQGRNLIVSAGKAINYVLNNSLLPLNAGIRQWYGMSRNTLGDVFCIVNGGTLYKQTGGTGAFVAVAGLTNRTYIDVLATPSGDIYVTVNGVGGDVYKQTGGVGAFVAQGISSSTLQYMDYDSLGNIYVTSFGDIYKQTGGLGSFVAQGISFNNSRGISIHSNNDVYVTCYNGDVYKQTGGVGAFVAQGQTSRAWNSIDHAPNGDVYACVQNGGVYKRTGGVGAFVLWAATTVVPNPQGITILSNGNIYVSSATVVQDIFKQTNYTSGTPNLDGGTLISRAGTGKGTGKSRYQITTGQKTLSGTDMQVELTRMEVDETGAVLLLTSKIYANNAAAVSGGERVGTIYWTSTGEMRIVI